MSLLESAVIRKRHYKADPRPIRIACDDTRQWNVHPSLRNLPRAISMVSLYHVYGDKTTPSRIFDPRIFAPMNAITSMIGQGCAYRPDQSAFIG